MDVNSLMQYTGEFFIVFSLAALSGMISERAGIVNVAIEGFMTLGALLMAAFGSYTYGSMGNYSQIVWFLVIIGVGALFSLMHSFISINLKCDQIIAGTAINLFMQGVGLFIVTSGVIGGDKTMINGYWDIISVDQTKILSIYLIISVFITLGIGFYYTFTRTGNRHIASGENPNALDAVGISVIKYRYLAIAASGALAALSGAMFLLLIKSGKFNGSTDGYGFLGLALMIIGQWRVKYIVLFSFIFAFIFAFVRVAGVGQGMPEFFSKNATLLKGLPFIFSLVVMVSVSKFSKPPAADGIPFDKSKR